MPNVATKLKLYRFDQMAQQINDRVENPAESGVERYVGLEHLDADSLRIRRWGDITDVESTKLRFRPGDIILGKRRVYQRKLAVADFEGICSAHAMVLRAKPDVVLPEFLPFFMQSDRFMERALEISVGSLSPTINWKTLAAEEFALPPSEEQRRMVEALQAAVEAIYAIEQLLTHTEQLRMSTIFAFESRVKVHRRLGSMIASLESGKSPPSTGEKTTDGGLGVLKVSAVGDWEYVPNEAKTVAPDDYTASLAVLDGDLLVARANADPDSVGRSCIVVSTPKGLMLSDKTWRAHLTAEADGLAYGVLAWTKSRSFRAYVRNHLNGTDAKNISKARFLTGPAPEITDAFRAFDCQMRELCQTTRAAKARLEGARECYRRLVGEMVVG